MIQLTSVERRIRRELLGRARIEVCHSSDACITYVELGEAFDPTGEYKHAHPMSVPPFRGFGEALGHVSMYEVEHGRPMLSALVVQQGNRRPGAVFGDLARHLGFDVHDEVAFWEAELERVVEFWSDDDSTRILDAALERVIYDLVAVKRLVRR